MHDNIEKCLSNWHEISEKGEKKTKYSKINRCLRFEDQHFRLFTWDRVLCWNSMICHKWIITRKKTNERTKIGNSWQIAFEFRSGCVFFRKRSTLYFGIVCNPTFDRCHQTHLSQANRFDLKSRCHYGWAKIKTLWPLDTCVLSTLYHTRCVVWCNKNFCIGWWLWAHNQP